MISVSDVALLDVDKDRIKFVQKKHAYEMRQRDQECEDQLLELSADRKERQSEREREQLARLSGEFQDDDGHDLEREKVR